MKGIEETDQGLAIDGGIVNGTYATCAAKVNASALRLLRHVPPFPIVSIAFVAFSSATAISAVTAVGLLVLRSDTIAYAVGFFLFALAAVTGLVALWLGNLMRKCSSTLKIIFNNALLTPAVVVSTEPLHLVSLANMTNDGGPACRALKRFAGGRLPRPLAIGTRVTCVSGFRDGPSASAWGNFDPRPLHWGTGDRAIVEARTAKLGAAAFEELEALIAGGRTPQKLDEPYFVDPPRLR